MGHRVFLDFKRWTKGVRHGLHRQHVQRHLDESVFRWNRVRHRRASFDGLLGIGVAPPPATCRDIVDGRAWRGQGAGTPCSRSVRAPAGRLCHPGNPRLPPPSGLPCGGAGAFFATIPGASRAGVATPSCGAFAKGMSSSSQVAL